MKKIFDILKAIAVSTLLSFVSFLVVHIFVRAIFENVENINPILYCVNMITYALFFYLFRTEKLDKLVAAEGKFEPINEAKTYFFAEGKYLLYIYLVLAVLCEINDFIVPDGSGVFFVTLCSMVFPFFTIIEIPILRSVLSILLASIIPLLLFEFYSFKNRKIK